MSDPGTVSIPRGKVLVTGGTGHVGANLVRRLLDDGHEVRCLVQPGADNSSLDSLAVEKVAGDLRDFPAISRAVEGCTRVFHVAAKLSTLNATAGEQRELYEVNVKGTQNICRASLEHGVARVVLTGSFSATGYDLEDSSRPANEDLPFYPFGKAMPYAYSKALAELELLRFVARGLDGVIATSCACVGPHDYIPSRMGRTMIDFANDRLRAYIDGGFPFVRAHDLVEGHVLAMEKGRRGEKYIFATAFHTLEDFIHMWSEALGKPPVRLKLPQSVMSAITGVYSGALAKFFPQADTRLSPGTIEILRLNRRADTSKAERELGWQPTNLRLAVQEALAFFEGQGKIPRGMLKHAEA